jgi:hypothetical protein
MCGWGDHCEKRHGDVITGERVRFGLRCDRRRRPIARRDVAAIEPDRIQTRCRNDRARAVRFRNNQTGLDCGDWSPPAGDPYRHCESGVCPVSVKLAFQFRSEQGPPPTRLRQNFPTLSQRSWRFRMMGAGRRGDAVRTCAFTTPGGGTILVETAPYCPFSWAWSRRSERTRVGDASADARASPPVPTHSAESSVFRMHW